MRKGWERNYWEIYVNYSFDKIFFNIIWCLVYLIKMIFIESNVYIYGFIGYFLNFKNCLIYLDYFFCSLNLNIFYFFVRKISVKKFSFFYM